MGKIEEKDIRTRVRLPTAKGHLSVGYGPSDHTLFPFSLFLFSIVSYSFSLIRVFSSHGSKNSNEIEKNGSYFVLLPPTTGQ